MRHSIVTMSPSFAAIDFGLSQKVGCMPSGPSSFGFRRGGVGSVILSEKQHSTVLLDFCM